MQAIFQEVKRREREERHFSPHSSICISKCSKFNETVAKWSENWPVMRSRVMELFHLDEAVMPPCPNAAPSPSRNRRGSRPSSLEASPSASCAPPNTKWMSNVNSATLPSRDHHVSGSADAADGVRFQLSRTSCATSSSWRDEGTCHRDCALVGASLDSLATHACEEDGRNASQMHSRSSTAALLRSWNVLQRETKHHRTCLARNQSSHTDRLHKQMQDVVLAIISAYVAAYVPPLPSLLMRFFCGWSDCFSFIVPACCVCLHV